MIVTPPGKGFTRTLGLPIVLSETEDPTLRFEVSFTKNRVGENAATHLSVGAAWLGVANSKDDAATENTIS